jgi:hypothetical protein
MSRNQHTQPSETPVEQATGDLHIVHRVNQILGGGHLLAALRREQRQLRIDTLRAEQRPQSLLLKPVAEHAPRLIPLLVCERRSQPAGRSVLVTEVSPVAEPFGLGLVG